MFYTHTCCSFSVICLHTHRVRDTHTIQLFSHCCRIIFDQMHWIVTKNPLFTRNKILPLSSPSLSFYHRTEWMHSCNTRFVHIAHNREHIDGVGNWCKWLIVHVHSIKMLQFLTMEFSKTFIFCWFVFFRASNSCI